MPILTVYHNPNFLAYRGEEVGVEKECKIGRASCRERV